MGIKRHRPEEIVAKLRQVEVLCWPDTRADAPPAIGVTEHRLLKRAPPVAVSVQFRRHGFAFLGERQPYIKFGIVV